MTKPVEMHKLAAMIAERFASEPDDYVLSIGDWIDDEVYGPLMREFRAYVQITLGDIRAAAAPPPLSDDARECLEDVLSHYHDFHNALEFRRLTDLAEARRDDAAYWAKQIAVLNRMRRQALAVLATPTTEKSA